MQKWKLKNMNFSLLISCPTTAEIPIFCDRPFEWITTYYPHTVQWQTGGCLVYILAGNIFWCCCLLLFLYPTDEGRGDGCLLQIVAGKRLLWWQDGARATRQDQARHQVGAIFGNWQILEGARGVLWDTWLEQNTRSVVFPTFPSSFNCLMGMKVARR